MELVKTVKKKFYLWGMLLLASLILLGAAFGVHCVKVNRYNAQLRTITSAETDENGVTVDIHQRGQSTDIWDKDDEVLGTTIKGNIYEATITNGSGDTLSDWTLTQNFTEDGFVNNAWCGTLEIHQLSGGGEKVQTLDLRNCDRSSVTLDYHISGTDILIDITPGSCIVYHPNLEVNEYPLDAGSSTTIGIILYSYDADTDLTDFKFEYHLHRDYLDSKTAGFYLAAFALWGLALLFFITTALLSFYYEKRLQEREQLIRESLDVFSNFVDAKDPYTKGHSRRVAEYSRMIAEKLGLSDDRCRQVYYIALLHDIGKCYVPDEILKKPSRLTDEEFDIIKTHTTHGAQMLANFSSIPDIREGALYHHERYDGKGYPTGCKGEDIPIIGRIICVADSYDAMSSSRVYRKKLPREVIIKELKENSGTQFDPKLVDIFIEILGEMKEDPKDDEE